MIGKIVLTMLVAAEKAQAQDKRSSKTSGRDDAKAKGRVGADTDIAV